MAKTPAAIKGDTFEGRLLLPYLRDEFGGQVARPRTSGINDIGDFTGIPGWTFEAKNYVDLARAVRDGLADLDAEQANAGTTYGAVIVKRHGKTDPAEQLFIMRLGAAVPLIRETAHWDTLAREVS